VQLGVIDAASRKRDADRFDVHAKAIGRNLHAVAKPAGSVMGARLLLGASVARSGLEVTGVAGWDKTISSAKRHPLAMT
jgi:hypothetical protein